MKTKPKKQNKEPEFSLIRVKTEDAKILYKIKKEMHLSGVWVVISKLLMAYKKYLSKEELR